MIQPAPIFLLINDEADGPHELDEIGDMSEEGTITEETLSCIEGMKGWRSVPETTLWSYAKLLNAFADQAMEMTVRMASHKLEIREARSEVREAMNKANCFRFPEATDYLGEVLYINGCLLEHHRRYIAAQQDWDSDAMDLWPASQIKLYGKQKFKRDWDSDWHEAGGILLKGKKAAKKDAPIWSNISDFGFPFPPFSMDVAVWMEGVSIDEAQRWGIPNLDTPVSLPQIKPFKLIGL